MKFSICDTGIGIPQDKLQTVFESFTQANASDTRRFGGTGLGLSISRQLVELMEGKISIESEVGSGTTISFEIQCPVGSAERLTAQRSTELVDGSMLDGLKILVADDNEYNRVVTSDTLRSKTRVEITEAINGQEALDWLVTKDFDVVLMDVQMPVMDGFEATRIIRKGRYDVREGKSDMPDKKSDLRNVKCEIRNKSIPIIALTASVLRTDLDKCREAGMDDYVPKPFKTEELLTAIARATGREIRFAGAEKQPQEEGTVNQGVVTDLAYLTRFCEGDKEKMQKYIDMFLSSVPAFIQKMEVASGAGDAKEISRQVHAYKARFMMMGMRQAQDLAADIELQCEQEENADQVWTKVQEMVQQVENAVMELKLV
jgi:CheY-like chemotaxis protein/HPt (histidine-containing phosphotransfer) domain-containing protein